MRRILFIIFCVFFLSIPCFAENNHYLLSECILFADPGDSYIGLFGPDWVQVFKKNLQSNFNDKTDLINRDPDTLIVGTKLSVPPGTYLTDRTLEKLSRYQGIKKSALFNIREAEGYLNEIQLKTSEPYRQGVKKLFKAKETTKGASFGFQNFIQASEYAKEAVEYFMIAKELQEAGADADQLEYQIKREKDINHKTKYYGKAAFLGMGIIFFTCLFMVIKRGKNKEKIYKITSWLGQHKTNLVNLENENT